MGRPQLFIGSAAIGAVGLCAVALILDSGPIAPSAAPLIAVGLVISAVTGLSGLLLARAPWGRWLLAGTVLLSMILATASSSALVWFAYLIAATALIGLFGPWLRLWIRHHTVADAPGPVPISLVSVAAIAALYMGLAAYEAADWTHWLVAIIATAASVVYGRRPSSGIWALRLVVPIVGVLAASHTIGIGAAAIAVGVATTTFLAWLPAARRVTAVITPPLLAPIDRRQENHDAPG